MSTAIHEREARSLLSELLEPYRKAGYARLRALVGHSVTRIATGESGTSYRLECFISRVHSREDSLSVSAIASDLSRRSWLPRQFSLGFTVQRDGSVRS